jgi:hypothetical protein
MGGKGPLDPFRCRRRKRPTKTAGRTRSGPAGPGVAGPGRGGSVKSSLLPRAGWLARRTASQDRGGLHLLDGPTDVLGAPLDRPSEPSSPRRLSSGSSAQNAAAINASRRRAQSANVSATTGCASSTPGGLNRSIAPAERDLVASVTDTNHRVAIEAVAPGEMPPRGRPCGCQPQAITVTRKGSSPEWAETAEGGSGRELGPGPACRMHQNRGRCEFGDTSLSFFETDFLFGPEKYRPQYFFGLALYTARA